ncbi:MAG TPA: autotransporter strand-loop-strand O-heptosyltransferase [Methylococcus sp.]|nr:autotransporter strand-loop-strand O-heptosyltransferase [Methylococcus sp.]
MSRPASRVNVGSFGFVDGAYFEVRGEIQETYLVQFTDTDTGELIHQGEIETNQWIRTARKYFTRWRIGVSRAKDGVLLFTHTYDCRNRRVYIAFESRSLGDTLAWFPALEEFRRQHGCILICSTFWNGLFRQEYPAIEFVEPGVTVHGLYAMYRLGWFYLDRGEIDYDRNVQNFREQPLAESAFDILGLAYQEAKPRIRCIESRRPMEDEYVCIAVHATAQAKYWNHETGWDEVVRFLGSRGYRTILLSHEGLEYMGNRAPSEAIWVPSGPIETVIQYLKHARLFIGVGSGLSWLAWAVGCRTCIISGFSLPYTEMQDCIRVFPQGPVCSGCFNRYRLDAADWNWCPERRDTPGMFECTRSITGRQVVEAIERYL